MAALFLEMSMRLYDFDVKRPDGTVVRLQAYAGKVLLIVNVASQCGFTKQYAGLQALHDRYAMQGLSILAFPCNQFGGQEPGSNEEIATFCETSYGVTFDLFDKVEVRGPQQHPLFAYLVREAPFTGFPADNPATPMMNQHLRKLGLLEGDDIKWNFTKFLISRDGKIIHRFEPMQAPEDLAPLVEEMLGKSAGRSVS